MSNTYRNWKSPSYTITERAQIANEDAQNENDFQAEQDATRAGVHAAFKKIADHIETINSYGDTAASNKECLEFALEQIVKTGKSVPEALKPKVRTIYADVRNRGGVAYADHKARLQVLAKIKQLPQGRKQTEMSDNIYVAVFQTTTKRPEYYAAIELRSRGQFDVIARNKIRYFITSDRNEADAFYANPDWNDTRLRDAANSGMFTHHKRVSPDYADATVEEKNGDGVVLFELAFVGKK